MTAPPLLAMPPDSARLLLSEGGVRCAPFLNMSDFAKHATDCGMPINAERLLGFERRGLFSPVFRLREPDEEVHALRLPIEDTVWFDKGWAIDISAGQRHPTPKRQTQSSEAFYSRFQIASLEFVLSQYELTVQTEDFLLAPAFDAEKWTAIGRRLYEHGAAYAQDRKRETKRFRPAIDLLCQFISDRYYPRTRSNMRVRYTGGTSSFSDWISVDSQEWRWETYVQQWDPKRVEEAFALTPAILWHAYEALAHQQSWLDPMENWYDLMQFVSVERREKLTGKARGAEILRRGALMLRMLHRDLYDVELPHPNEIFRQIIVPMPELEVRSDVRRYLEFVVNRYDLNPAPKLTLFVEGPSEELAVREILTRYFGSDAGVMAIEIIVLGGVDNATGASEDRFRAIFRLVDYLHHHQTFAFVILDNERSAKKLKGESRRAKSLLHRKRFVTRPEYLKVWRRSFEFDNFSATEIAAALNDLAGRGRLFTARDIVACRNSEDSGAALNRLYRKRAGGKPNKLELSRLLVEAMLDPTARRPLRNRPIVAVLQRVVRLAVRNPFPHRQEDWEVNQSSRFLGKARGAKVPRVRHRSGGTS